MFSLQKPDLYIGGKENPYLLRWYLIPRNRFMNIYLHCILRNDDDRALHDHPWWSISFLLKGILLEYYKHPPVKWNLSIPLRNKRRFIHHFLHIRIRSAEFAHRLELVTDNAWTLFITGPRIREWGFHCPQGWKHWTKFTDETGAKIGKGCAE